MLVKKKPWKQRAERKASRESAGESDNENLLSIDSGGIRWWKKTCWEQTQRGNEITLKTVTEKQGLTSCTNTLTQREHHTPQWLTDRETSSPFNVTGFKTVWVRYVKTHRKEKQQVCWSPGRFETWQSALRVTHSRRVREIRGNGKWKFLKAGKAMDRGLMLFHPAELRRPHPSFCYVLYFYQQRKREYSAKRGQQLKNDDMYFCFCSEKINCCCLLKPFGRRERHWVTCFISKRNVLFHFSGLSFAFTEI